MIPKFRAWLKEAKRMVWVIGINFDCDSLYVEDIAIYDQGNSYNSCPEEPFLPYEVILMQSTGLTDINGKEIYEGDIMLGHTHEGPYYESNVVLKKVVVVWDSPTCSFRYRDLDLFFGTPQKPHTFLHEKEIVGNIYENPECLQKDMAILNFLFNLKAKDYQEFLEKVHKND